MRTAVAALLVVCSSVAALAQSRVDFSAAAQAADTKAATALSGDSTQDKEYAAARLEYDKFALHHAQRTYEWQFWASIFIFVLVITAVGLGLWMSFLHFYEGRKGGGGSVKVSPQGVELSSPVIGLMILVVSLAFFYLYLTQVYPITEISR
jgi:hypothetical protein